VLRIIAKRFWIREVNYYLLFTNFVKKGNLQIIKGQSHH